MNPRLLYILPIILFSAYAEAAQCEDGWVPYKDELCVKSFANLLPYQEAKDFCISQGSNIASLVMVKEAEMQDLLANYTNDIYNTLWLGGKYDEESSQFIWDDGEPLTYTNWQEGYPRNSTATPCIELRPINTKLGLNTDGVWADVNCLKQNQVMCQKALSWTLQDAINEIIRTRKELETAKVDLLSTKDDLQSTNGDLQSTKQDLQATKQEFQSAKQELQSTKEDLQLTKQDLQSTKSTLQETQTNLQLVSSRVVPVGSIYIEYFNQPSPSILWPNFTWDDISSTYAGMFFRAYGSGSGGWGVIQSECAPRISHVQYDTSGDIPYPYVINITSNGWSQYLPNGWYQNSDSFRPLHRFHTQGCEVRPKNQAVRVWKRRS